jgi:thioredoxin-like negative regulator of GroEL
MNSKIRKIIFIWLALCFSVAAQEMDMANTYYKQGEYDKAAEIYRKLSNNKDQARLIHNEYLATMIKLKDIASAEKFLKTQIRNNSNLFSYRADLAQLYEISGRVELANQE